MKVAHITDLHLDMDRSLEHFHFMEEGKMVGNIRAPIVPFTAVLENSLRDIAFVLGFSIFILFLFY